MWLRKQFLPIDFSLSTSAICFVLIGELSPSTPDHGLTRADIDRLQRYCHATLHTDELAQRAHLRTALAQSQITLEDFKRAADALDIEVAATQKLIDTLDPHRLRLLGRCIDEATEKGWVPKVPEAQSRPRPLRSVGAA